MTKQASNPKPAPRTVQVGRHTLSLPQPTPEQRARAAQVNQLDRYARIKEQHTKELAAKDAQLAQERANHRHDSLVIIASQRADAAKLTPPQKTKFIANVLNADRSYVPRVETDARGKSRAVPFNVQEVMTALLDQLAAESKGEQGTVDVRKLSPAEYREHLRKRGLVDPMLTASLA